MADSRTEAGADPGAKRARVVAVPGSERARVIAALDFAEVLSTSSIDDDFKRVATALGGEHIFVPGSDKENGARRGARRKKMLSTLRKLWQKESGHAPTTHAPLSCFAMNTGAPRGTGGSVVSVRARCATTESEPSIGAVRETAPLPRANSVRRSPPLTAVSVPPPPSPPPPSLDPCASDFDMVAFMEYHRSFAPASPPSPTPPTPPPARHGMFYDTERQEEERQRRNEQEEERRHCRIVGPDSDGRYWAYPIYGGQKRPLRYHACYHGGYMAV